MADKQKEWEEIMATVQQQAPAQQKVTVDPNASELDQQWQEIMASVQQPATAEPPQQPTAEEEYRPRQIQPMQKASETISPFMTAHPNLYGAYGAIKEVSKAIPFSKYLHQDERKKFMGLSQQEQTRDILMETLWTELGLAGKPIAEGSKLIAKRYFPKSLGKLVKTTDDVAGKILKYQDETGKTPDKATIAKWIKATNTQADEVHKNAASVDAMFDAADRALKKQKQFTASELMDDFMTTMVDVSHRPKKALRGMGELGKDAIIKKDLIVGATGKGLMLADQATKRIYTGLDGKPLGKEAIDVAHKYIQMKNIITTSARKKVKNPVSPKQAEDWISTLDDGTRQVADKVWREYTNATRGILDERFKAGYLTKNQYEALVDAGPYSQRLFLKKMVNTDFATGKKISQASSGIKRLGKGSEDFMSRDYDELLKQSIVKLENDKAMNEANLALEAIAKANPKNALVKEWKPTKNIPITPKTKTSGVVNTIFEEGKPVSMLVKRKAPDGFEPIAYYKDGKQHFLLMPKEMAKGWVKSDPLLREEAKNIIQWITLTKPLKAMATGMNPEFAVSNMPRDIARAWLVTDEYSSFFPKFVAQMANDIRQTAVDAITRKGSAIDYILEGGSMDTLTKQGRIFKNKLDGLQNLLGWAGETSEVWVRLAIRNRALKNMAKSGRVIDEAARREATWLARNQLDFAQGGNFAKALDAGIPYFNAAIQGGRGMFRAFAERPAQTLYKAGQVMTMSMGLYYANRFRHPEAMAQIPDRENINNFVIALPKSLNYKDKDGKTRYTYVKIAKDQSQRFFATLGEAFARKMIGDPVDAENIAISVQEAIPFMPISSFPPTVSALFGYMSNTDFWRQENIWDEQMSGGPVKPELEYTRQTPEFFKQAGKATGLSPERMRYALSQVFTHGNIYTDIAGWAWDDLMQQAPEEVREATAKRVLDTPFVRRLVNETSPDYALKKKNAEIELEANSQRYERTREFDDISQGYYDGMKTEKDVWNYIDSVPYQDRKRIIDRHMRRGQMQNIVNKSWWFDIMYMANPEAKALAYHTRYEFADDDNRKILDEELYRVPGVRSARFFTQLEKLRRANND